MSNLIPPENTDALIGFGLLILSEVIGMSRLRDNSILQLVVHLGMELFPYELKRRDVPTRANRPRLRRRAASAHPFFTIKRDEPNQ